MLSKQKQSSCPPTIHINIKKHIGQQTLEECRAEEHNGKSIEFEIQRPGSYSQLYLWNMRLT